MEVGVPQWIILLKKKLDTHIEIEKLRTKVQQLEQSNERLIKEK